MGQEFIDERGLNLAVIGPFDDEGKGGIVAAILREEEEAICEGFPIDSPGLSRQRGYVNRTPVVKILRGALERPEDVIPKSANQAGGATWEAGRLPGASCPATGARAIRSSLSPCSTSRCRTGHDQPAGGHLDRDGDG